jgi:radical SAM protein with 4Fe4S-binding SPASM domain
MDVQRAIGDLERINRIVFILNNECNLNCSYCFAKNYQSQVTGKLKLIDFDFAKSGVDEYIREGSDDIVEFFGSGEPTLGKSFERMKQIVDYARETKGKDVRAQLITNGVFNQKVCEWVGNNVDILVLSWDGLPHFQNTLRPARNKNVETAKIIEDNLKILQGMRLGKKKGIWVRVTMTEDSYPYQKDMIDYYEKLGIECIYTEMVFNGHIELDTHKETLTDYHKALDCFVDAHFYAEKKGLFYHLYNMKNFYEKTSWFCTTPVLQPAFSYDGFVSACIACMDEREVKEGNYEDHVYGRWNSENKCIEYDLEKMEKIASRTGQNMFPCKNCGYQEHCGGGCPSESLREWGTMFKPPSVHCNTVRYLAPKMLGKVKKMPHFWL